MNDRNLYPSLILNHYRNPRNRRNLSAEEIHAEGSNPNCGDRVALHLQTEGEKIVEIFFSGCGCAICMASTSIMTDNARGKTPSDLRRLSDEFIAFMQGEIDLNAETLGDLFALAAVRKFPMRIKCAILPWQILLKALD